MDCQGTDGQNIVLSTCTCGWNNNGTAFCAPLVGDQPGVNYVTSTVSILKKTVNKCNTARRGMEGCLKTIGESVYHDAIVAWWGFYYYPQLQGNDVCVKTIISHDYWYGPSGGLFIILSGILSLFF